MVASGFAGLGYQIVWTQQGALWLGHEAAAVLAVVTAFFGGLAVGALGLGPRIQRSSRPQLWYAACEVGIAAWSVALALGLAPIANALLALTGAQPTPVWQWLVAFGGSFLILLPATAAMGATLPAMERVTAQLKRSRQYLAALYACNTLGAVIGVLASAFWLVPQLGLVRTAALCAALNVLCALAALRLASKQPVALPAAAVPAQRSVLVLLAATGLLGIGYEVLVVRVLSQVAENTIYTFALLLAVYLIGTAGGAAAYQRMRSGESANAGAMGADLLRDRLLHAQAAACLLGSASLWGAEHVKQWVVQVLGPGMASALAAEATLAFAAFALPTLVMGALFSHLCTQARAANQSWGTALGVNTVGAAAAPLLFGVLLLPLLGPKFALLIVAVGYLGLSLAGRRATRSAALWAGLSAAFALAVLAPRLAFVDVPPGGRIVSYHEGAMAAVSVVEDAQGVARLRIDNRQQEGSSATQLADSRQALLPLLLHAAPRRALFLGLGTGITASAAAEDPTLQVDAVELLPEVIAASAHFTGAGGATPARLHIMTADARRFVKTTEQSYDVIVSDNFHPARSGSGSLYTVEHFAAVRGRLTEQGVFCQWLPLHQLDLDTLRSIVQSFVAVYPDGWAVLATNSLETPVLGLLARNDGGRFEPAQLRERLQRSALRPADFGFADEFALLGSFVAGPQALARFAADAPLNTDDRPIVAYRAPRITYAPDSLPRDRLLALLGELDIAPAELVASNTDAQWSNRLAAYGAARNRYLDVGRSVQPSADAQRMLLQVREPLLSVLRISPDFRPAYDPLLRIAIALARADLPAARSLLAELKRAQPERPEAEHALARLAAAPR